MVDPVALAAIQPELLPGEAVLWAGRPAGGFRLHREDAAQIPFSLLWGGFSILWEWMALRRPAEPSGSSPSQPFLVFWGIPFIVAGQYMIWGRFLYGAWRAKCVFYAVTNRRVIAVETSWRPKMAGAYIDSIPVITKETSSRGVGTLRFTLPEIPSPFSRKMQFGDLDHFAIRDSPVFVDISEYEAVYQLISSMREKQKETAVSALLRERGSH